MYATSTPTITIENLTKLLFSSGVFKKGNKNRGVETRLQLKLTFLPRNPKVTSSKKACHGVSEKNSKVLISHFSIHCLNLVI
jgi:hypothetical protein